MSEELEIGENPDLKKTVGNDTPLKEMIVNYTGEQLQPENGEITVEMIVEIFAKEFPEFLLAVAEENWIRGYHQAFVDLEADEELINEKNDESTD